MEGNFIVGNAFTREYKGYSIIWFVQENDFALLLMGCKKLIRKTFAFNTWLLNQTGKRLLENAFSAPNNWKCFPDRYFFRILFYELIL